MKVKEVSSALRFSNICQERDILVRVRKLYTTEI
jgi:hypothetical protein